MSRPDFTLPTAPTRATSATLSNIAPAQALAAGFGGGAVGATFRQVHSEVRQFIEQGGGMAADAGAGSALNADGAALRARLAARTIVGGDAEGADAHGQQAFLDAIRPHAQAAAARLGVAPELVAAHAALESGWGRHVPGNNPFGIKAGANWQGAVQVLATQEVEGGLPVQRQERFRGYSDMASAFDDYAGLLLNNPRYRQALQAGADARTFANGLAAGGYATDPAYAAKLQQVAQRVKARD